MISRGDERDHAAHKVKRPFEDACDNEVGYEERTDAEDPPRYLDVPPLLAFKLARELRVRFHESET